jgi:hypothetical protein
VRKIFTGQPVSFSVRRNTGPSLACFNGASQIAVVILRKKFRMRTGFGTVLATEVQYYPKAWILLRFSFSEKRYLESMDNL